MHVGATLEAHQKASELVQPGQRALDRPANPPEARSMGRLAAGDYRADAALTQLGAVGVVVIAAVSHEDPRAPARATWASPDRPYGVD